VRAEHDGLFQRRRLERIVPPVLKKASADHRNIGERIYRPKLSDSV
jgi:hypothetical protein